MPLTKEQEQAMIRKIVHDEDTRKVLAVPKDSIAEASWETILNEMMEMFIQDMCKVLNSEDKRRQQLFEDNTKAVQQFYEEQRQEMDLARNHLSHLLSQSQQSEKELRSKLERIPYWIRSLCGVSDITVEYDRGSGR